MNGTLAFVKDGTGTLTLLGGWSGNYTGGLTVKNGTLDYSGGELPICNYTINGGTLNIGSLSQSIKTFQITGGTVTGTTGRLTSNTAYDIEAGTVGAILAGTNIALNKTTSGTAILTASDTYTGATTISAGTLQLGTGGSTGSLSTSTNITVGSGGTFDVNRSGSVSFTSKISGAGTLAKDGTGTLTLSGNSFSGNLFVNNGTLTYSGTSVLPVGNYTVTGGTLSLGARSQSIGAFQITGGTVTGGTLTSNAAYDVQAGTVGTILAGSVSLNKTGTGSATVASPTYTGTTSVSAGSLAFSGSLPGGSYAISGGTLNTGALSKTIGAFQITGGTVTGTGTLTSGSAYDIQAGTVSPALAGTSIRLNKTGSGTAILNGGNTYTGLTTVAGAPCNSDWRPRARCSTTAGPTCRAASFCSITAAAPIPRQPSWGFWRRATTPRAERLARAKSSVRRPARRRRRARLDRQHRVADGRGRAGPVWRRRSERIGGLVGLESRFVQLRPERHLEQRRFRLQRHGRLVGPERRAGQFRPVVAGQFRRVVVYESGRRGDRHDERRGDQDRARAGNAGVVGRGPAGLVGVWLADANTTDRAQYARLFAKRSQSLKSRFLFSLLLFFQTEF